MKKNEMNIQDIVMEQFEKMKAEFSSANVLIAGKTGVGKSSLINAVFHSDLAKTGCGTPVTQEITKFSKLGMPINIYDTKGLELANYKETLEQLKELIEKLRKEDADEHIHLAWICIDGGSDRFEDGEKKLIELLNQFNIPIIMVITKTTEESPPLKQAIYNEVGDIVKDIVAVSALGEELKDRNGNRLATTPPEGLKELISISYYLIPEGKQSAFVSAQKISLDLKQDKVGTVITTAAGLAGAAATSPIPFSDSAIIVPIQIGMIVRITMLYGIPLGEGAMAALASSVVGCTAATAVGRSIVGNLLKFIPGVGTLAGDAINATVAFALTKGLGELYNKIILELYSETLDAGSTEINVDSVIGRMQLEWKNR
jgi:uncharacterized protein (DUF697 family)/GTP-binding protein EngB required for normal cell division